MNNIFFCNDNSLLISNKLKEYYLAFPNYNHFLLIGFNKNGNSFIAQIKNKKQIGYIFYRLHEYQPLKLFKYYNILLFDFNKDYKLRNIFINEIILYNKFWKNKVCLQFLSDTYNINTNYFLGINTKNQCLNLISKEQYNTHIDKNIYFSSINTLIKD